MSVLGSRIADLRRAGLSPVFSQSCIPQEVSNRLFVADAVEKLPGEPRQSKN
jgi:hypothetical protein